MKRAAVCFLFVSSVAACTVHAQSKLSAKWEELTASDFRDAIQQSKGTCLLPFGILEKHGPHLPLGTDLLNVRHASLQAAQQEYADIGLPNDRPKYWVLFAGPPFDIATSAPTGWRSRRSSAAGAWW